MEGTLVFIDGGFLSKLSRHFGNGKYLIFNIIEFSHQLALKQNLYCEHIFYYTAPPFQSNPPTKEENQRKENYDKFIKKLSKNEIISIKEGRCQGIRDINNQLNYSQKGVDTRVTIDLISIPIRYPKIKKIILIACDSDFVPVIKDLQSMNIKVVLYTYFERNRKFKLSTSNELIKTSSKYVLLNKQYFDNAPLKDT
jgi:uncharacterized LabA/DUF88 family protein